VSHSRDCVIYRVGLPHAKASRDLREAGVDIVPASMIAPQVVSIYLLPYYLLILA
jgi:hypothetical protein